MSGASQTASALTRFNLAKAKVLALDDNVQSLAILSQILLGFGVGMSSKCATAGEARLLLERETYNLVILDDQLPGESGFDLAESIRREPKSRNFTVPIILVSGNPTERTVLKARNCGANFVIAKPIVPGIVLDRIEWLARSDRGFVVSDNYRGPDRRNHNGPLPDGVSERRLDKLRLLEAPERTLSQDEVNSLFD
jgi:DNA-binding response OmpR family regulator